MLDVWGCNVQAVNCARCTSSELCSMYGGGGGCNVQAVNCVQCMGGCNVQAVNCARCMGGGGQCSSSGLCSMVSGCVCCVDEAHQMWSKRKIAEVL